MKRRNIAIVFLFFIVSLISFNKMMAAKTDSTYVAKGISVSYWGTLKNNNGLKLSLEKYYLQTNKFKVIASSSFIFQRKKDVYTTAGIILGSALRRTYKKGLYFEHGIEFGYLGSYYDFDLYKTNSNGSISNIGRKWRSSILLGYAFGLGYDFSIRTKTNLQLFIKPNLYYRLPNNDNVFYLNNYSIEVGIILHPKWINNCSNNRN